VTEVHDVALRGGEFDFRVRVYPTARPDGALLVWLHGGAFMFGTLEMPEADQVGRRLSAAGISVVSVDYTLAPLDALEALAPPEPGLEIPTPEQLRAEAETSGPRARFPVASLQIVEAFDWAVANADRLGADPSRVALGGASAGGNLATGAAMRLRDRATTAPSALALVYPVLHAPLPEADDDLRALLDGLPPFLTFPPEATTAINANYLGDADDQHGYAFAGGHDLRGLPPTLIVNADRDRLRASGEAFGAELATAGVDVRVVRERGAVHGFLNKIGDPVAERTLALIAEVLTGNRPVPGDSSHDRQWPAAATRPFGASTRSQSDCSSVSVPAPANQRSSQTHPDSSTFPPRQPAHRPAK
jgi:acetyl esterase/lipase